jgi:hypothetical protein
MIYLICCKNLCKCHSVPPPSTTIKEKKIKQKTKNHEDGLGSESGKSQKKFSGKGRTRMTAVFQED